METMEPSKEPAALVEGIGLSKEDQEKLVSVMSQSRLLHPWKPAEGEACIYRVPDRIRRLNPEPYTPQMVLIGPLHHSKKREAREMEQQKLNLADSIKSRYKLYLDMEMQKTYYLQRFAGRVGVDVVLDIRNIIVSEEENIRKCYAESTASINTLDFVDIIFFDAIFIIEIFCTLYRKNGRSHDDNDMIVNQHWLTTTVYEDMLLLENQLPYYILKKLYDSIPGKKVEFLDLTLRFFADIVGDEIFLQIMKGDESFKHFTDLFRLLRTKTLGKDAVTGSTSISKSIRYLHSAKRLQKLGVNFVPDLKSSMLAINVRFDEDQLIMPYFVVHDDTELSLGNVIALEQCHYPGKTYVSSYLMLLNYLIKTDEDLDLLVERGIVINRIRRRASLVEMVNKLCLGVVDVSPHYYRVADQIIERYDTGWYQSKATLRHVYFSNLWTGMATVGGVILLALTVIQTAVSILQLQQGKM